MQKGTEMAKNEIFKDLIDEVYTRIVNAVEASDKGFIWKKYVLKAAKNIFKKNQNSINIDYLVDFLTTQQKKNSPRDMNIISLNHRALLMRALYSTIVERINEGYISKNVVLKILRDRWEGDFFDRVDFARKNYLTKYNRIPPGFVLISPSKHCNLNCTGCYASSTSKTKDHLDYSVLKRIIKESHEQWGARSVAISGGEPLMYRSEGKTILDLAEEFPYLYFKIYTNGTLINENIAEKMANLANISPAISIEGTRDDTDLRRGNGTYNKILSAMQHLRNYGVPFGVSITATSKNIGTLLDKSYYDFLFNELKITYGWIFEYMPIGRGVETNLMPKPSERKKLFELLDEQNKQKRFICDFWSTSPSAEGCIAAGRSFGYLYINWNGDVVPCVFNPYSDINILDVFKRGGTLTDAVENSYLFKEIRKWQNSYGFQKGNKANNYLIPCPIRDHYKEYKQILLESKASPIDFSAKIALDDSDYYTKMISYGEEVKKELDPIWKYRFHANC